MSWIDWMKFCDSLDEALKFLSTCQGCEKKLSPHGLHQNSVKATVLKNLQEMCDKQATKLPAIQFTLYCPFYPTTNTKGVLIENWHIQFTVCQEMARANHIQENAIPNGRVESDMQDSADIQDKSKGEIGKDYIEHTVLPTDTLQGICLRYKVALRDLKRANCFFGNSLQLAPNPLIIPTSRQGINKGYFVGLENSDTKEYKIHALQWTVPKLETFEATA